jgi:hypothetical protein
MQAMQEQLQATRGVPSTPLAVPATAKTQHGAPGQPLEPPINKFARVQVTRVAEEVRAQRGSPAHRHANRITRFDDVLQATRLAARRVSHNDRGTER